MEFLWYGLGFVLLVMTAMRIAGLRQLLRLRLRTPTGAIVEAGAVPEPLRAALTAEAQRLAPLGFTLVGWSRSTSIDRDDTLPLWSALLRDADGTWAMINPHPLPEAGFSCNISFHTVLADSRIACTALVSELAALAPIGLVMTLWSGTDPARAFDRHGAAVRALGAAPMQPATAAALEERLTAAWTGFTAHLVDRGGWIRDGDDAVRPRLGAAWRLLSTVIANQARLRKALAADRSAKPPVPPAVEADAMVRAILRQPQAPNPGGLLLLVVSFAAFIAIGSFQFEPLLLAVLLGVLLLHECGHWLAMRWFGYRDLSMFFLPMLGAAVTGRKHDATAVQQVLVSLAGPLPGMVLGVALAALVLTGVAGREWWMPAGMLLAINWFNLLPVLPLDGGHILRRLLFARTAWLDAGFHTLGVVALALIGWNLGPLLLGVAVLLGLGLPQRWRTAGFLQRLRRELGPRPGEPDAALVATVAVRMAELAPLQSRPFANRLQVIRSALDHLAQPGAGPLATAVLLAVWLFALLAPVAAVLAVRGW